MQWGKSRGNVLMFGLGLGFCTLWRGTMVDPLTPTYSASQSSSRVVIKARITVLKSRLDRTAFILAQLEKAWLNDSGDLIIKPQVWVHFDAQVCGQFSQIYWGLPMLPFKTITSVFFSSKCKNHCLCHNCRVMNLKAPWVSLVSKLPHFKRYSLIAFSFVVSLQPGVSRSMI